jgi:hypothetical protein
MMHFSLAFQWTLNHVPVVQVDFTECSGIAILERRKGAAIPWS